MVYLPSVLLVAMSPVKNLVPVTFHWVYEYASLVTTCTVKTSEQ